MPHEKPAFFGKVDHEFVCKGGGKGVGDHRNSRDVHYGVACSRLIQSQRKVRSPSPGEDDDPQFILRPSLFPENAPDLFLGRFRNDQGSHLAFPSADYYTPGGDKGKGASSMPPVAPALDRRKRKAGTVRKFM